MRGLARIMLGFGLLLAMPALAQTTAPANGPPPGSVPLTLAEAVFLGLRENRAIRSEYLQRIADRFALRVAERTFIPRLDLQAGASRARVIGSTTTQGNFGPIVTWDTPTGARFQFSWLNVQNNTRGDTRAGNSQLSFQVIQPLLAGGGVDFALAPVRIARISERNAQLRIKASVIDQISGIILAYRNLVQAQEQLRIAGDSLRRSRDLNEVNRALIAAGRLAQVELIQSETSIAQQELALVGARNAAESARLALLTLMALDQGSRIWAVDRPAADSVRRTLAR